MPIFLQDYGQSNSTVEVKKAAYNFYRVSVLLLGLQNYHYECE